MTRSSCSRVVSFAALGGRWSQLWVVVRGRGTDSWNGRFSGDAAVKIVEEKARGPQYLPKGEDYENTQTFNCGAIWDFDSLHGSSALEIDFSQEQLIPFYVPT
ncbi:hypothetical protein M0657_002716 [Pyricularia oryzae]|uniref:Uncharacterized protein n=1 Tax=Pyricularia oryzae TaxID=318829 RepID=A0A4P7N633_PYROR|nr:hypothetical protein M9X92_002582 [Pyricularia oryzae]KAI7928317.1 hypothetical protein M0657_002716 [Pyricularia oryzae]QBZ58037.1 hypothetical protein PoMZ_02976 [Pyricularia oryzae]